MPSWARWCAFLSGDVGAVEPDGAGHVLLQAGDHVERGRLAGAVRADEPGDDAGLDVEIDVAHGAVAPELHIDAPDFEQGHQVSDPFCRSASSRSIQKRRNSVSALFTNTAAPATTTARPATPRMTDDVTSR